MQIPNFSVANWWCVIFFHRSC